MPGSGGRFHHLTFGETEVMVAYVLEITRKPKEVTRT
jgi:hypothetical protein